MLNISALKMKCLIIAHVITMLAIGSPQTTVNMSDIPSGLYILRVTLTDGTVRNVKVVKVVQEVNGVQSPVFNFSPCANFTPFTPCTSSTTFTTLTFFPYLCPNENINQ